MGTEDPNSPVIALNGLTKRYGMGDAEHTVLDGIDLIIEKGEFIASSRLRGEHAN